MFQYVFNCFYPTRQVEYLGFAICTVLDFNWALCCIYICLRGYTLVNIFRSVIEHAQHRHNSIAIAIGATNLAARGAHIVDVHPDSARPFTNERTVLQRVVNAADAVLLHCD